MVLLALCAVPAADAIRSGLGATSVGADKARELRCLRSRMETVLAESYDDLYGEARDSGTKSPKYSLAADPAPDGACGERNVFIHKYVHPYGATTGQLLAATDPDDDTLLLVIVSGADGGYPLTTLVDR